MSSQARKQGLVLCPVFADHRVLSWSYVAFWVSPKWSHSFPACSRSPLGLAPSAIDTSSVDVMVHARQASSTYAWFNQLDIVFLLSLFRGLWVATSGGAVLSNQFEAVQTGMVPEAPASTGSTSPPGGGSILPVSSSGQYSPHTHTHTFH